MRDILGGTIMIENLMYMMQTTTVEQVIRQAELKYANNQKAILVLYKKCYNIFR